MSDLQTPYVALLPPLSSAERDALKQDVAEHGVQMPLLITEDGVLLDGHNRADLSPDAPRQVVAGSGAWSEAYRKAFVMGTATKRRNMSPEQWRDFNSMRKQFAGELKVEGLTQERIATVFGVSRELVKKWLGDGINNGTSANAFTDCRMKVTARAKEQIAARVDAGGETKAQIAADYGISQQRVGQIAKTENARRKPPPAEAMPESFEPELHHCSLEDMPIDPGTVHAVITDPPYPREFLPLYGVLAQCAVKWLRPGGSLVVMTGQSYLPEVLSLMTPYIKYQWALAYVTPGEHTTNRGRQIVNIGWKPVIWFRNGIDDRQLGFDVIKSDSNDKAHHHWGQSVSGMERIIEAFTLEGDTIADPFLGGGTTAVAACRLRRNFIGCDVDEEAIDSTLRRFA